MPWSCLNKALLEELLSPSFLELPSSTSHYQKWIKSKSNEFQIHHWNAQFMPHSFTKTLFCASMFSYYQSLCHSFPIPAGFWDKIE